MKWLRIKDNENEGPISTMNVASMVFNKQLIAYDKRTENPIDWLIYKQYAQTIKEFYRTDYGRGRFRIDTNAKWVPFEGLYELVFDWTEFEKYKGTEYEKCFNNKSRLNITYDQKQLIQLGWNIEYIIEIINKYGIFKQSDITKALNKPKETTTTEVSETEKSNLLKIIGALIKIHYLQNKNGTYIKGQNNPNISAITNHIHRQLEELKINKNGLLETTLRKKIKVAIEEIAENKEQ